MDHQSSSNITYSVPFSISRANPLPQRSETKSAPLVNKKIGGRYMIENVDREEKELRETKPSRQRKEREKKTKININKAVKATSAHECLKYIIHRGTNNEGMNNEAPKTRKKTYEFESRFRSPYERDSQKCSLSTAAVKSIAFKSFLPRIGTNLRKYSKGNCNYSICYL